MDTLQNQEYKKKKPKTQRRKITEELYSADDMSEHGCTYKEHFESLEKVILDFCGEDSELTLKQAYSWMFNFDEDTDINEADKTCFVQLSNTDPPYDKITGIRTNMPNPIIMSSKPDAQGYAISRHTVLFRDDWLKKLKEAQESPFAIINGIAYYGNRNILSRSGQLYGLMIDLDGLDANRLKSLLGTMFFSEGIYPMPNIIGLSGNNAHLVYLLEKPVNLTHKMRQWLKYLKYNIIFTVWNKFTSSIERQQLGSLNQGFRILSGARTKIKGIRTKCFAVKKNAKWELFGKGSLSDYITPSSEALTLKHMEKPDLPEIAGVDLYGKPRINWDQAKEKWPQWAEEVEKAKEEGRPRQLGGYKVHRNFYDYWKKQITLTPYVGVRFFRIWSLAVVAAKCSLSLEELEKDADELQKLYDLIGAPLFPFTKSDEKDALKGFYDEKAKRYTYRLLCGYTGVPYNPKSPKATPYKDAYYLQKEMEALRNGTTYEKEQFNRSESFRLFAMEKGRILLERARNNNPDLYKNAGRKSAANKIIEWHEKNQYASHAKCAKELNIAQKTALKHYHALGYPTTPEEIVREYQKNNPDGKPKECRDLSGLSLSAVYEYWEKKPKS